jgi:hypothetical protein
MAGNGRPIIPGQMAVETTFAQGPLAQPAVVTIPTPGQLKILTIGGLSKVEALAGQIAGTLAMPGVLSRSPLPDLRTDSECGALAGKFGDDRDVAFENLVATRAVNIAEAILAECNRRVAAAQEQQAKPQIEGGGN